MKFVKQLGWILFGIDYTGNPAFEDNLKKIQEHKLASGWQDPIEIARRDAAEAAVMADMDSWDEMRAETPPARPQMPDIKGFDKRADRERRWRTQGPGELRILVPYMKSAGVFPEIIKHAEEVLADMEADVARKYK